MPFFIYLFNENVLNQFSVPTLLPPPPLLGIKGNRVAPLTPIIPEYIVQYFYTTIHFTGKGVKNNFHLYSTTFLYILSIYLFTRSKYVIKKPFNIKESGIISDAIYIVQERFLALI
jgi:hypothetical protein